MRTYKRTFDWDEAAKLRKQGATLTQLARRYGVSTAAVNYATNPQARQHMNEVRLHWGRQGRCPDCGTPTTRVRAHENRRCPSCAQKLRRTAIRPDTLLCQTCKQWKPDIEFHRNNYAGAAARRHRASECKPCSTISRRQRRQRGQP